MTRNPLTSEEWAVLRASVQQSTTDDNKKKWGQGRASKPEEDAINRWVAQQLISDAEWQRMEARHPGDLKRIAEDLELPVAAVIWRARSVEHPESQHPVELTPEAVALVSKPANGSGGIQSLLRSLQANLEGNTLTLRRKQFERLREYLVNLGGGGRARMQPVMDCVLAAVMRAGSLQELFGKAKAPAKTKTAPKGAGPARAAARANAPKAKPANVEKRPAPAPPPEATPQPTSQIEWRLPVSRSKG